MMLVLTLFGGLGLFIYGMKVMTDGLKGAAGARLRQWIQRLTQYRLSGLTVGTAVSVFVHSSATTLMLVGFIHAGLMTLPRAIPVMLGANIGTTLSMQIVSFGLGDYCYLAIAAGVLMHFASRSEALRYVGLTVLGFGLLFLGMEVMKDAIAK